MDSLHLELESQHDPVGGAPLEDGGLEPEGVLEGFWGRPEVGL